jgi:UDP-glucose 4-epimerase
MSPRRPMKILVIGAAGFIGSHTVDHLLAEGHQVIGLDDFRTGRRIQLTAALASPRFTLHEASALVPGVLDRIVGHERPHAIIHLAALVSVQESLAHPELNAALNVELPRLVAETMRRHRIARLVFASSAAVYGNSEATPVSENSPTRPISPYGAAKLASETHLLGHARADGFAAICLRYFNAYGPRQDPASPYSGVISIFADRCARGLPVTIHGDGGQTRDFIHVADIARANALAATGRAAHPAVYNICTGRPTSLKRLLEILRAQSPACPPPQCAAVRSADIRHSCGDPEAARRALGFAAQISVEQGLASLLCESEFVGPLASELERAAAAAR